MKSNKNLKFYLKKIEVNQLKKKVPTTALIKNRISPNKMKILQQRRCLRWHITFRRENIKQERQYSEREKLQNIYI